MALQLSRGDERMENDEADHEYESEESWAPNSLDIDNRDDHDQQFSVATESPRKRRAVDLESHRSKVRRLDGPYNDQYRQLLNADILDAATRDIYEARSSLPPEQIGASEWSSEEKEAFFAALTRLGKCNTQGIAAAITSKSQFEVQQYLDLLESAFVSRLQTSPADLLEPEEIAGAAEISQKCCDALDAAADSLSLRQDAFEQRLERHKHRSFWKIDASRIIDIKFCLRNKERRQRLAELQPAAELFDLSAWLELSRNIFMNSGGSHLHDNWQSIADDDEEPSILCSALLDFYLLVVSVTRRLMSAALFSAISRSRALDTRMVARVANVKSKDVAAATKILDLRPDSRQFWTDCARRCRLDVYSAADKDGKALRLDYDEVEAILRVPEALSQSTREASNPLRDEADQEVQSSSGDVDDLMIPGDTESEAEHERVLHDKMMTVDLSRSHDEEMKLFGILQQSTPAKSLSMNTATTRRSSKSRRVSDSLCDWREHTRYQSPWETEQMRNAVHDKALATSLVSEMEISKEDDSAADIVDSDLQQLDLDPTTADEMSNFEAGTDWGGDGMGDESD